MTSSGGAETQATEGGPEGSEGGAPDALGLGLLGAVIGVTVLALSQPVLDLLGQNPEFFVARHAPRVDAVLLILLLALGLPLLPAGVALLAHRVHPRAGRAVAAAAISLLGAAVVVRMLEAWRPGVPGLISAGIGLALGAGMALAVDRSASFRSVTAFGIVLPLVLVVQTTFFSPLREIVAPSQTEGGEPADVGRPGDVVMIVFDELPLASLLQRDGEIDAGSFPNFARLARDAVWYRDASTVHHFTLQAVPSLVTGRRPRVGALPRVTEHPDNLFTLLGATHEVIAHEPLTALCPEDVCASNHPPFGQRWTSLSQDVAILGGHAVLPRRLRRELPPVNETWGGFGEDGEAVDDTDLPEIQSVLRASDPVADLTDFIEAIRRRDEPSLMFHHSLLPHVPWRHLPDGTIYSQPSLLAGTRTAPGHSGVRWGKDEWLVAQAYQRHLIQVMYVDTLLGRVLDRLRDQGLYDRATIVVSADHGASFYPDTPRRQRSPKTLGGIAAVPLFVKTPGRPGRGATSDAPTELIDVLPTILDILEANTEAEEDIEGISLLGSVPAERERFLGAPEKGMPYPGRTELDSALDLKFSLLGQPGPRIDPWSIVPEGAQGLLGEPAPESAAGSGSSIEIARLEAFEDVDLSAGVLPALVEMELERGTSGALLAVALNGRIAAVTRTYVEEGTTRASALLPPSFFQQDANTLQVFEVDSGEAPLREVRAD